MKKILTVIKYFISIAFYLWSIITEEKRIQTEKSIKNKYMYYYQFMQLWFDKIQNNTNIDAYFKKNKIDTIIIYGTGSLCDLFYKEIIKIKDIKIICMIDKNPSSNLYKLNNTIPVLKLNTARNYISKADAIIITPIFDYNTISLDIKNLGLNCNLISLETIINYYE